MANKYIAMLKRQLDDKIRAAARQTNVLAEDQLSASQRKRLVRRHTRAIYKITYLTKRIERLELSEVRRTMEVALDHKSGFFLN